MNDTNKKSEKTVTLNRSLWGTGFLSHNDYPAYCALGFYLCQAGFQDNELKGVRRPSHVIRGGKSRGIAPDVLQRLTTAGAEWLVCPNTNKKGEITGFSDSKDAKAIMGFNDDCDYDRLDKIRAIFAKHGIKLDFK